MHGGDRGPHADSGETRGLGRSKMEQVMLWRSR